MKERMSTDSVEKKLSALTDEIGELQREMAALDEQYRFVADNAEEARVRALVSETALADHEYADAQKSLAAVVKDREARVKRLEKLESKLDALLDKLTPGESP